MSDRLERTFGLTFLLIVVLVVAHVVGVPHARSAALLAILFGAALLGVDHLTGERTRLDVAAGVLLPVGAVVGAAVGVFGVGTTGAAGDGLLVFAPLLPGVVALCAARRRIPILATVFGVGSQ